MKYIIELPEQTKINLENGHCDYEAIRKAVTEGVKLPERHSVGMTRKQAINYLRSSGMSEEQINSVCDGLAVDEAYQAKLKADISETLNSMSEQLRTLRTVISTKTELQKMYEEIYMPIGNENLRRRREE